VEIAQWLLRGALAAVFVGMGVAHFFPRPARTMAAMIPPVLTTRISSRTLVRFTGLCELAGGVGLLLPATRVAAAVCLTAFLIAVFPANARAAADPERFGSAAIPFWPRLVGQLILIALVLVAGLS
jgi:uncharacterized membrane protein